MMGSRKTMDPACLACRCSELGKVTVFFYIVAKERYKYA